MGLSFSLLKTAWGEIITHRLFTLAYNFGFSTTTKGTESISRVNSFKTKTSETEAGIIMTNSIGEQNNGGLKRKNSIKIMGPKPSRVMLDRDLTFKNLVLEYCSSKKVSVTKSSAPVSAPAPVVFFSPRPVCELDAAATKVQKVYKSYRTRRNLADCAVVVEELWWKAIDSAALKRSSVSFFNNEKPETAVSRWARARTRAAKVGKGLSKNEKAQKLALQHWLEAIDPRHRYGHNLHLYYDVWFVSESTQPFFYWLDVGDGKEVNLDKCPRIVLQRQCITYLGPKEREAYEVIVEDGKLVHKQSGELVQTKEGSKWIFVLSTSRLLYVGQKKKGVFQHSSFLSGAATTAAGRLVAHQGIIEAIWPYSGHYHPTEENFKEFISFLQDNHVDLTNVKRCAIDDDDPANGELKKSESADAMNTNDDHQEEKIVKSEDVLAKEASFKLANRLSCKWATGTGPRIGCVRDYPTELQTRALEQVKLSPRVTPGSLSCYGPIPSPRPHPNLYLSPRLAYMGLPSPRTPTAKAN